MFRLKAFVFSAVLCSLVVLGQGDASTEKPVTITVPKPTTTTPAPETTSSTTLSSTTSSTEAPTTPSSTSTTSTTEVPPTEPPKPTPPPAPTPLPAPTQGTWHYDEKNVTCIVVQFAARLNVTYTMKNSTIDHLLLNVPDNATVPTGSCSGNNSQWLTISWPAPANTTNNLTLVFQRNDTTHNYALSAVNLTLSAHMFPNASMLTPTVESWHGAEWLTPLATSYRCAAPASLNMGAAHDSVTASLTLSQLQEEAFRSAHGTSFSAARECGGGDVPDAVPIAVGCALGGLVVVVLVAYLVARRRSAARGYLSM